MHKKVFGLILVDQIAKLIFWSRDFFIGSVRVHSIKNFGLAFNLNFGLLANIIIMLAALGFFIYYYIKNISMPSIWVKISFALIFAGAIANLIDRLYLGYVRDFLDLGLGFTFNLADAFLVIGLIGFLVYYQEPRAHFSDVL